MAVLSSDKTYVTVQKGDTLSEIVAWLKNSYSISTTVSAMASYNNLKSKNLIYVNQKLYLSAQTVSKTKTNTVEIDAFGLQADTDRTIFITWNWDKDYTDSYTVRWLYDTGNTDSDGDTVWFVGSVSSEDEKQSTYNAPSNAKRVCVKVKPVSKTKTVNKKETSYWTADWSVWKTYKFSEADELTVPSVPTVEIEGLTLTAEVDNYNDENATYIQFQVVKNDSTVYKSSKISIKTSHAAYSCTVAAGNEYKVRCRAVKGSNYGDWSDYSDNYGTRPNAPKAITKLTALSSTSVYLDWDGVSNATTYTVEYTKQKRYFDSATSEVSSSDVDATVVSHMEITGLESGEQYFFRLKASNDYGDSSWTAIKSIIIGEKPAAPTTWSSVTTINAGESVIFYWMHNTNDGSYARLAQIEITVNGTKLDTITKEYSPNEDADEPTYQYTFSTKSYASDAKIKWRVRTAGITEEYGPWSTQRTVQVVESPTLELSIHDSNGNSLDTITSYPFRVTATAGPSTQKALGYHISISSKKKYETVDSVGNTKIVGKGEVIYSKYFDTRTFSNRVFSADSVDLENNVSYTMTCVVSMSSGLTATDSVDFSVKWSKEDYEPNAELFFDEDNYSMSIRPYCEDEDGVLVSDIRLAVYRREFDGKFTEIASGLRNSRRAFVTDPHPSLDYARYRIVASSTTTSSVSYYDMPPYPIEGTGVIIQWDEDWSEFETDNEDELEEPPWNGSLLRLPYNIDVSNDNSIDVSLINYIGREHPTTYYGTHVGEKATWNVEIEKDDKETLYSLRRLAVWMGDVYVREPSGSGYWANISVSYSQTHCETTIPVTFSITRVEGGA